MSHETKKERKDRLKAAGVWRDFIFRRAELKNSGYTAQEANKQAAMEYNAEEYPDPSDESGGEIVKADFEDMDMDPMATMEFVFNHIGVDDVRPEDAPCPGAWSYLENVKADPELRKDFYSRVWPKLLKQVDNDEHRRFEDDGRKIIDLAERLEAETDGAG